MYVPNIDSSNMVPNHSIPATFNLFDTKVVDLSDPNH